MRDARRPATRGASPAAVFRRGPTQVAARTSSAYAWSPPAVGERVIRVGDQAV
jgi:hypothetical protein